MQQQQQTQQANATSQSSQLLQHLQHQQHADTLNKSHLQQQQQQLFSCLTWGHNDQRLFVACSNTLHVLRVYKEIPSFSLLSQIAIKTCLRDAQSINSFCLPERLKDQLKHCFASTIKVLFTKICKQAIFYLINPKFKT